MDREFWSKAHRCSSPRSTCGPSRATCLTLGWLPSTSWLGYQRFLESQEGFLHGLHVRSDHKERETGGHQEQLWNEGLSHLDCKPCSCKEGFCRTQTPRSLQWSCCLLPWSQFNYWNGRRRADIEPSRPITVLSVHRWWSRVTTRQVLKIWAQQMPDAICGFLPARSAHKPHFVTELDWRELDLRNHSQMAQHFNHFQVSEYYYYQLDMFAVIAFWEPRFSAHLTYFHDFFGGLLPKLKRWWPSDNFPLFVTNTVCVTFFSG